MKAIFQAIFDSPLRHGAIPAHGGLAHFAAQRKVVSISTPDELNAAFVARQDGGKGDLLPGLPDLQDGNRGILLYAGSGFLVRNCGGLQTGD